jgi:hypothetical protein
MSLVLYTVISENVDAIGALLVGVSALVSSLLTLKHTKSRGKDECEQRIADIREAFQTGARYELRDLDDQRKKRGAA